ncbi:MAG: acyltransferase [Acidimicrobiales bacterium]
MATTPTLRPPSSPGAASGAPAAVVPGSAPATGSGLSIGSLVDATPAARDRYVDFLRAVSILVVIAWHWVFSITQWNDGALAMPNPISDVPGLWLATWLLQIMPVFFFVGGYANLAAFEAVERGGGRWAAFARTRLRRLLAPIGVFVGLWAVADGIGRAFWPGYRSVLSWGMVVFVPLWFLGVYVAVVLLAPFTIRLHRAGRELALVGLGAGIALAELARFRFGVEAAGLVGSALVWVFAHQLGYFWRDGTLVRCSRRLLASMAVGAVTVLVVLTNLGPYPRSMVSERTGGSNMFPTTACIAALAVLQIAVVLLLRPSANRWLAGRRPWSATVAVNAVAMTLFTWHMTALVAAIGVYQLVGGELLRDATGGWWLQRPLWLGLPAVFLGVLLAVFARFELPGRRGSDRAVRPAGEALPAS